MGRSSIADLHTDDTVKIGLEREGEIKTELRKLGPLRDSTTQEDRRDKIDGHYTITQAVVDKFPETAEDLGKEVPIQIKDREGVYPDLLFEARSDRYEKGGLGRDYKTRAKYIFCRPYGDHIHHAKVANLRALADTEICAHEEAMETDYRTVFSSAQYPGVEIRRQYDRRDNYWKVLLFVPGEVLSQL